MFTGIVETLGKIEILEKKGSNLFITISSSISNEFKIDQSISHNGVCLTVIKKTTDTHTVTAIDETLQRTNLGELSIGSFVNLERAMMANARLDGHIVQGHVDATATCIDIKDVDGSWYFTFRYTPSKEHILVDKGSICINGVSLTLVEPKEDTFQVAIIPYTFEHTTFRKISIGDTINLEFDIIGKYIAKYAALYMPVKVE